MPRKNRYVEELHLNDPDHNPTSFELLLERSVAKERESGSTKMQQPSSIEETHAKQLKIQTNQVYNYSEEVILVGERKWNDIPACQQFRGNTFEAEVSRRRPEVDKTKRERVNKGLQSESVPISCDQQCRVPCSQHCRVQRV